MIITMTIAGMLLTAQETRPPTYVPDPECYQAHTLKGWEVKCPPHVDEKRRNHVLKLPPPTLPGHESAHEDFQPRTAPKSNVDDGSGQPLVDYPLFCRETRIEFSDMSGRFLAWLANEKNSSAWNSLTREAAYSVEQMVRSYITTVDREATAKFRYAARDGNGDQLCADHFRAGSAELRRIGQLIVDELNKGNRDLVGTGLNPYAHESNK